MKKTGISNRETPKQEAQDRKKHPPLEGSDGTARGARENDSRSSRDEQEPGAPVRQVSRKAGSRSSAQKADASPYTERTMPAAGKVPGAFGKEEGEE